MRAIAIEQAEACLQNAVRAYLTIKADVSVGATERAWSDFLTAGAVIYNKLQAGAKGDGPSMGWMGRKVSERREDPLLRYLHQARDVSTHGLRRVAYQKPGSIGFSGEGGYEINGIGSKWQVKFTPATEGEALTVTTTPDQLVLEPAVNEQYGHTTDVPAEHRGKKLEARTPLEVAGLALNYLRTLLDEATALPISQ